MANTADLVSALSKADVATDPSESARLQFSVLVPNLKGLRAFFQCRAAMNEIAVFTSASEGFSRANANCSVQESITRIRQVTNVARQEGLKVRGYVSCVVQCPYDGLIDPPAVCRVSEQLMEMGCYEVSLGDTIGTGTPSKHELLGES